MNLAEYASFDATGLARLVARGEVTPRELAALAARAVEAVNPRLNAVIELYEDRIAGLEEAALGAGPFRGVPFLMKDVFGYEKGRPIEFCSRLCQGMVCEHEMHFTRLLKAAGFNLVGRTNTPEYSMAGTTENLLYGNTSNPWREGFSAGGSSGGAAAAVAAGIVPAAHGTDIAGSIRIPAGWCGGVGLKPSRGRISFGPVVDENGFGLAVTFVQTKTVRDTAALLDVLAAPCTGDPFTIPRPAEPWTALAAGRTGQLRIGVSTKPLMGVPVDPEVAAAVERTAATLEAMGHAVEEADPDFDGLAAVPRFCDLWFFGFDLRLEAYGAKTGRRPGPDTLEPVTLVIYEHAKRLTARDFMAGLAELNRARRALGAIYERFDIWLGPTLARPAERWGRYSLTREDVPYDSYVEEILAVPCQHTVPHNILGTPAITLPLAMHSSGLPIGIQLGAAHAREDLLLQLAAALEEAMPWADRMPPLHVSRA